MDYQYDLSIISPVYNEEASLQNFMEELHASLVQLDLKFEIILVDDCSTDNSWTLMNKIIKEYRHVTIIQHHENSGHVVALESGFRIARGQWQITLDSDLQHPPTLIPKLWELRTQSDVISTKQISRNDRLIKKLLSSIFYPLLQIISGVKVNPNVGDFRLIHASVVQDLLAKNEFKMVRFQLPKYQIKETIIDYQARARFAGTTNYSIPRMLRLAEESLVMLTKKPLYWGLWLSVSNFIIGIATFVVALVTYGDISWESTLFILVVTLILFVSTSILLAVGMLGLYFSHVMGRIHLYPPATIGKIESSS